MQLKSLLEKFTSQLQPTQKLIQSTIWLLPVHTIQLSYKPVLRRQMDILMKMLLISIQKAPFISVNQISEILLVEHLFVKDLIAKMEKMGLIIRNETGYEITEKGKTQLESGIYEEDQEATSIELLYSSSHDTFLSGDLEEVLEYEDFPESIYRYYIQQEQPSIQKEIILEEIQTMDAGQDNDEEKTESVHITSIDEIEYEQINDIPCIEMLVYDEKTRSVFTRVWNTLLNKWDHEIEEQITKKESSTWKEKIIK